jgi:hypothetical protein
MKTPLISPIPKPSAKENMGINHILIYEEDEDPK